MHLYLFRHGEAEDAPAGKPDSSRALTAKGVERSASVVKMARDGGVSPSLIVSSPYLRAMQTAEVAAKEFGWKGEIVQLASLVPHGTPEGVWSDLRDLRDEAAIVLAGHEPLMANLAAYLLNAPELKVDMKKSAMIHIESAMSAMPRGVLRWMIVPKLV